MQAIRNAAAVLVLSLCFPALAATIRVAVDRGEYAGPLEVRIGVPQEEGEPKWIQFKRLAADVSSAELAPLAAGTYIVLVSGDAPFERFAARLGVRGEGDEVLRLALPRPRHFRGTIRLGDATAGDAVLGFRHAQFDWRTNISARPDGTFDSPLWQDGEFVLIARGGALPSAVHRLVRIDGDSITVDLSPLRITGVVSDADGAPIPEANVALRNDFGRDRVTVRLPSDAHGMFEFVDVKPGPYILTVAAEGYLIGGEHHVYVTGETPVERVGVTLESGVPRSLRIVDAAGRPVPDASVNIVSDGRLRSTTVTDVEGRATASLPPTGSAAAWVIPRGGSFAVVRLEPGQSGVKTVVVPDGVASVVVDVLTSDRSGVSGLALLMRYNGELLLPNASAAFGLRTDEKGRARLTRVPPGLYEFWPFASAEEAATLMASQAFSPSPAPITVEAVEGESRATVVVEKKVGVVQ